MSYPTGKSIKYWAEEDRPREKLILKGKSSLSNAEILAILIGSGNRDESAVELSQRILTENNNNLNVLSGLSVNDLKKFKGIGEAKALNIIAALELGRRRRSSEALEQKTIRSSRDAFELLYADLADKSFEEFWIILLKRNNQIISKKRISEGGIAGTVADPKKIFKMALDAQASSIILCHNHPSGNLKASEQDNQLTHKIVQAGKTLEIAVLDHLIFGNDNYFSFADENILS
ncbi:MAG: DNA repair protein RadC [Bacteroidales bacterium]|nr:DNA repair protein RadC [Bacteroidales bacterium]